MPIETDKQISERDYSAKPADEGRVHAEHAALRETFERLDYQVMRLTERLVKVLQPEENAVRPTSLTAAESKPISPLAAWLQEDAAHMNRVADQISELIDRLEV